MKKVNSTWFHRGNVGNLVRFRKIGFERIIFYTFNVFFGKIAVFNNTDFVEDKGII